MEEELKKFLDEDMSGVERRVFWEKLYLRLGLIHCGGHRQKTADFLGYSLRGLREILKRHRDVKEEFPTFSEECSDFYKVLSKDDYPWYKSKKEKYTKLKIEMLEMKRRSEMEDA